VAQFHHGKNSVALVSPPHRQQGAWQEASLGGIKEMVVIGSDQRQCQGRAIVMSTPDAIMLAKMIMQLAQESQEGTMPADVQRH